MLCAKFPNALVFAAPGFSISLQEIIYRDFTFEIAVPASVPAATANGFVREAFISP